MKLYHGDPIEGAKEHLKLLNKENSLGVKFFSLDNEPLNWSVAHPDFFSKALSADQILELYVRSIVALREAQERISGNPYDITIFAPELSSSWTMYQTGASEDMCKRNANDALTCRYGPQGRFDNFLEYALFFFHQAETGQLRNLNPRRFRLLDYLSLHFYPQFRRDYLNPSSYVTSGDDEADLAAYLDSLKIWTSKAPNKIDYSFPRRPINFFPWLKALIGRQRPNTKVAITEFGIDAGWLIEYHPLLRPLYQAEFLAIAAYAGMSSVMVSYLNHTLDLPGHWAMVRGSNHLAPSYHTFALMSQHFRGRLVDTQTAIGEETSKAQVHAYGALKGRNLSLALFNRGRDRACIELFLITDKRRSIGTHCIPKFSMQMLLLSTDPSDATIDFYQYGAEELRAQRVYPDD